MQSYLFQVGFHCSLSSSHGRGGGGVGGEVPLSINKGELLRVKLTYLNTPPHLPLKNSVLRVLITQLVNWKKQRCSLYLSYLSITHSHLHIVGICFALFCVIMTHVVRDGFELIKYLKLARTPDPHACWDDRHISPRLAL